MAAWAVIGALNFAAREPPGPQIAERQLPRASDVRLAVKQKQQLMADLALLSEPAPAKKAKAAPASPRSERSRENLNT